MHSSDQRLLLKLHPGSKHNTHAAFKGLIKMPFSPVEDVVVVQQPTAYPVGVLRFGRYPLQLKCPNCQADILTTTSTEVGTFAWCMCVLIACFW